MLSSTYLRLFVFLLPILTPAYNSSNPAFLMMCSAYRLNKQGEADSPVVLLSQSQANSLSFPYSVLTCFLTRIQVSQETGKMVWYCCPSKSFSQFIIIHTVKSFSVVDETEINVFLKFPCFLYNPANVGNLISSFSSFSKPSLDI